MPRVTHALVALLCALVLLLCVADRARGARPAAAAAPHVGDLKATLRAAEVTDAAPRAASAAAAARATEEEARPLVRTQNGDVRGEHLAGGGRLFAGVPFARAPVGALRWRPPQPAQPWRGALDCGATAALERAHVCPQVHADVAGAGVGMGVHLGSEDCLYLDVVAPSDSNSDSARAPVPVLAFIYGGAFELGDDNEFGLYNATALAEKTGFVVVTLSYRVGVFGFLALDALAAEQPSHTTGNYGLQDQRAALQWVQRNIGAFGGDPSRVTLFGESAGGMSVCFHLSSSASAGLFAAAIIESGDCGIPQMFVPREAAVRTGAAFAESLGCTQQGSNASAQLACMRALGTDAVMHHSSWPGGERGEGPPLPPLAPVVTFAPAVDGAWDGNIGTPLQRIRAGKHNRVPVIFGTNQDEGTIFVPLSPLIADVLWPLGEYERRALLAHSVPALTRNESLFEQILAAYPVGSVAGAYASHDAAVAAMLRDYVFVCEARRLRLALVASSTPAWQYLFRYAVRWPIESLGTYHSSELPFVFRHAWPSEMRAFDAADWGVADTFTTFWANFAAGGDPNAGESPPVRWPPVDSTPGSPYLAIDAEPTIEQGLGDDVCDLWDAVPLTL